MTVPSFVHRPAATAVAAAFLALASTRGVGAQQFTLQQAIAMSQRQSYVAEAAASTRDAARQRDHAFAASYLPSLLVSGNTPSYTRSITPVTQPDGTTLYIPLQETDANLSATVLQKIPWTNTTLSFTSGLNRVHVAGDNGFESWSSTPFSVGISQPILRSNSQRWDIREQDLRIEASERKYLEAREDAALTTTNAFFDLYAAGANLKNAEANVSVNDTLYTLNKGRLAIGKIGENDLLQSELALLRARASVDDAKLAYDRALAQFRLTVNLPANAPVELVVTTDVPVFDVDTTAAVQLARNNSSTVTDATAAEVDADRRVSEARYNSGVGGTINANYGFNATGTSATNAYENLLNSQRFSLSVQVPLWQWGAHSATVAAANADRDAIRDNATLSRAQLDQNARFAALSVAQARRGLELAAKGDTVANKRFDVAYNRYGIGKITIDNLYIAQTEKDQAVQGFAQALRAYWAAYFQLRKITLYDFERQRVLRADD
jgi:outer membrane protein